MLMKKAGITGENVRRSGGDGEKLVGMGWVWGEQVVPVIINIIKSRSNLSCLLLTFRGLLSPCSSLLSDTRTFNFRNSPPRTSALLMNVVPRGPQFLRSIAHYRREPFFSLSVRRLMQWSLITSFPVIFFLCSVCRSPAKSEWRQKQ